MTLAESQHSTNDISFAEIANGAKTVSGRAALTYVQLAQEAVRGGWPGLLGASPETSVRFNRSYNEDLTAVDLPTATGIRHEPVRVHRLLASLARNIASEATLKKLAADVGADGKPSAATTIRDYLDALTTIFAYEELPAWSVSVRSRSRLRTSPRIHLADPSLALAALGIGPDRLARNPDYFGQIFESMAIRDLRVYAAALDASVYHYRDNTGLEIDAIIEFTDWSWAAAEIKLGHTEIPQAEAHLMKLRDERVDLERTGQPRFLAVITGTEYAYTLPSGIHVIPLSSLTA
jgi:predicted AAA+ superfamily ATPase